MKLKAEWIIFILIVLESSWLIYEMFSPKMSPGNFTQITGMMETPRYSLYNLNDLASGYRRLELVTPDPYVISPNVWLSCMAPTPQEEALLQSDHAGYSVRLYASEEAVPVLQEAEGRTFPFGTIIIKEKLLNPDDTEPTALGMMIKRENGFDPAAGDWVFAYWLEDGTLIEGNETLSNCVQCHREQSETDMVFWKSQP